MKTNLRIIVAVASLSVAALLVVGFAPDTGNFSSTYFTLSGTTINLANPITATVAATGFSGAATGLTNYPYCQTYGSYCIIGSALTSGTSNYLSIHETSTKSAAEGGAQELYIGNGRGAWVSNFWVYDNSGVGTSTNAFYCIRTNGVSTTMGFVFSNGANTFTNDSAHPFFIPERTTWDILNTNNSNIGSGHVLSWGIAVYPQ